MKPILWRLRAWRAPGLPRPTKSSMAIRCTCRDHAMRNRFCDSASASCRMNYFFFSSLAGAAFAGAGAAAAGVAPAAGAAAPGAGLQPQEIDMHRRVLDDSELVVARNRPLLLASDIDLEDRRQEFTLINQVVERLVIERDRLRGLAATIDHARNTTFTANAAGGPLAGPVTHRGRELLCLGHCDVLA